MFLKELSSIIFKNFTTFGCTIKNCIIFAAQKLNDMIFDKILGNDTLWAVRYDNEEDNSLRAGKRAYIARTKKDGICTKPFN